MDRIVAIMNSADAPNGMYIETLNAIVYNPELALDTTIGHEWYHAATNLMLDQERRTLVNQSVRDEYRADIKLSAERNGYTVEAWLEQNPDKKFSEVQYNKWIT